MFNFLVKNLETIVDEYREISSDKLYFSKELIESCKMNHCGKYNKNWMCPPALENQADLLKEYQTKYNKVFVFSKIQKLSDPFDIEGMDEGRKAVEKILKDLINKLTDFDYQILGPGTCSICAECTYPDADCRFPHLASPSLEAMGINVMDLAKLCSIKYYNGINTVTYFAAIFYNFEHSMIKISVNDNKKQLLDAYLDENVLSVLRRNDIYIPASCGGNGSCRKCKVRFQGKVVLACEQKVVPGMEIELIASKNVGLEESFEREYEFEKEVGYGIAIDLGTTTIAAYLVDLETGVEVGRTSSQNLQSSFGADVISRIKSASQGSLDAINKVVIVQINKIINEFINKYKIADIKKIVFAANTTMLHLLAKVDPTSIGTAPYQAVFLDRKVYFNGKLGIEAKEVILLPSISSFVGSDIVSGILACDIYSQTANILFCDLGTNGEIILKTKQGIIGTSTAAGPAFEGAKIECGMAGISGAVSKLTYEDEKITAHTINNQAISGICGSGLVDLISLLVNEGVIDETGAFDLKAHSSLKKYIKDDKFYLSDTVYLSQRDVREFQLAKSAIASGIQILFDEASLSVEEIDLVYLAGGFGFYINKKNATRLGLLPKSLQDKIISVGNSSGLGAKMALVNRKYLDECDLICQKVKVVELANNPKFSNYFIDNLMF